MSMMHNRWCQITGNIAMLLLSTTVLINYIAVSVAAELTTVIKTTSGPIQGEILTNVNSLKYAAFKGIPYAKAPVGYLRFKPPVAVDPWTKVLNTTVEGNDCPQFAFLTRTFTGSEDCLFLNVVTPVTNLTKTPKKLKPVMVWIFGGGFNSGTSSTRRYRPDYIIEKDIVYVSLNYRLGPLGFLSLRHRNATGNAGLKDQVLALKWIQANIRNFGGNPNNVTIFGQSAGATAVGSHVLSDASTGLFHGAISMSGPTLGLKTYQTPAEAQGQAEKLGAALGATSNSKDDLLKALYKASAADIINAASKISSINGFARFTAFSPTIEDESIATDVFMPQCSLVKYATGNFNKVPQMMGFMDQETVGNFSPVGRIMPLFSGILNWFEVYRSEWPQMLITARNIIDSWTGGELNDHELQTLINVTTDVFMKSQVDINQRILAVNNDDKPVYYYQVSYFANVSLHNYILNNTIKGAGHSDDLAFLFYYPEVNYSTNPADPTRVTINRITTMWTNFAKYGDPTPNWIHDCSLNVIWPASGLSGQTLDIGTELTVRPRLITDVAKFVQMVSWPLLNKVNGCHL